MSMSEVFSISFILWENFITQNLWAIILSLAPDWIPLLRSPRMPVSFIAQQQPSSSVQFSCSVVSNSLRPHGLQDARLSCPSPAPGVYSNSCPLNPWCHPTISSSVVPFSSCLQSFPASGFFFFSPISQFFTSGGQSIGVSASTSVLPMNIQDCCPLRRTGWISLQSRGLSRVFSNATVLVPQFKTYFKFVFCTCVIIH